MLLLNRKAYTLSQFVLLWVLGILFVILVCLNAVRYHATAQAKEAEDFMQRVRAEQEDRCTLGRKYAVYKKNLRAFSKMKKDTKSIRYDISSGTGITAHHKLLDFRLQMPSYADGRICCDNCEKLNHYYSHCDVLKKRADFISAEPNCAFYETGKKSPDNLRKPVENEMPPVPGQAITPLAQEEDTVISANQPTEVPQTTVPQTQPTQQTEKSASVTKQPIKTCKMSAQGDFFIDECSVYQAGTRGNVVHTWNKEKCAYDITQTCILPARWKAVNSTKEEKGLYPSDLEDYCPQLLKSMPCPKAATVGQECGNVDSVCYKNCQITNQTEVRESSLIVLYDVQVQMTQLRCMPAKEVIVSIP